VAALVLAVVALVFTVLTLTIVSLHRQTNERRDAQRALVAANRLQKSVLDLETGARAFLITRRVTFLEPWRAARDRFPTEIRRLETSVTAITGEGAADPVLARRIGARVESYFYDHSLPLVLRVQSRRLGMSVADAEVGEGKARVDEMRVLFARLLALEAARADREQADAGRQERRASVLGVGGLALILATVVGGIAYLARTVTRPVIRVAEAASALAAGRLERDETVSAYNGKGAREVVSLTKSFDAMAEVVRTQRERLEDHNALLERRVSERTSDLEQARYEALLMLAVAAEFRDDDTHRHTQRVARNAARLGQLLGLGEETTELLRVAAPLHDVGKIGIPDSIMLKPGRLTVAEFEMMKQHVAIGTSILGASTEPLFHIAAEIARTHHERWDGSGYLEGLKGEEIPLAGRIVAVVDVFDALTHARPYKEAWPVDRALEEIRAGAGSHFDPAVVAALEQIDPAELTADAAERAADPISPPSD
jgi:response regulator RpfG family c-di-GMP phosphodiesterase/CHASE3 domain sensor protein